MALTNLETQMALKARRQAAYKLLKTLALESGTMQHWKDSDGYDEFIGLLESGEFVLRFASTDETEPSKDKLKKKMIQYWQNKKDSKQTACQTCNQPHEKTYGENNEWCENCVPY